MRSAAWVAGLSVALLTVAATARAEIEVVAAKGVTLERGSKLPDDTVLDIPKGGDVRLLKQPGDAAYAITGPFKGTLQDYIDRCTGWRAWFSSGCGTAGGGDNLPVGGTRGLTKPE